MRNPFHYLGHIHYILPLLDNTVTFRSFQGMYNDNPKYVSEKLHEVAPDVKIVWVYDKDYGNGEFPDYVKVIEPTSKEYLKYSYRSRCLVDNYTGFRMYTVTEPDNPWVMFITKLRVRKRKGQLNVSTWHGTPLKHIGSHEKSRKGKFEKPSNANYVTAGCKLMAEAVDGGILHGHIPIKMYGTPRNDAMFMDVDTKALKQKLGIPADKKVLLYAPTFRDTAEMSGAIQLRDWDTDKLLEELSAKFGGEWCFVVRMHNLVLKILDIDSLNKSRKEKIINGNLSDDMADYLRCTDLLITDYSSSMFDYALKKKICILYAPDIEHYENDERGFYLDIKDLPFPMAKTTEEIIDMIRVFDEEKYVKAVDRMLTDIGNCEDGNASGRVVDDILYTIKNRRTPE